MRALDLFSGAGGMATGLHRAGVEEIVGVDIERQRNYPFHFVQGEALTALEMLIAGRGLRCQCHGRKWYLEDFGLIHASPPCQGFSPLRHLPFLKARLAMYPDLVTPAKALLKTTGLPWIIENVRDAPRDHAAILCGTMFERKFYRHRYFETNWPLLSPAHPKHRAVIGYGTGINYRRTRKGDPGWAAAYGHQTPKYIVAPALGIDWMTLDELNQAMPPIYGEYVGRAFLGLPL